MWRYGKINRSLQVPSLDNISPMRLVLTATSFTFLLEEICVHVKGGFYFNYLSNPPIMGTIYPLPRWVLVAMETPHSLFSLFSFSSRYFSPASSLHHLVSCKLHVLHQPKPSFFLAIPPFMYILLFSPVLRLFLSSSFLPVSSSS